MFDSVVRNALIARCSLFDGDRAGGAGVGAGAAARAIVSDARDVVFNLDATAGASIDARAATNAGTLINCSSHSLLLVRIRRSLDTTPSVLR